MARILRSIRRRIRLALPVLVFRLSRIGASRRVVWTANQSDHHGGRNDRTSAVVLPVPGSANEISRGAGGFRRGDRSRGPADERHHEMSERRRERSLRGMACLCRSRSPCSKIAIEARESLIVLRSTASGAFFRTPHRVSRLDRQLDRPMITR